MVNNLSMRPYFLGGGGWHCGGWANSRAGSLGEYLRCQVMYLEPNNNNHVLFKEINVDDISRIVDKKNPISF